MAAGATYPLRRAAGAAIVIAGLALLPYQLWRVFAWDDVRMSGALLGGTVAALATALATALGTLPVLLKQQLSERTCDTMLGFGADVMLAACAYSLVLPALSAARAHGCSAWGAGGLVGAGVLLGAASLMLIDRLIPHEHFVKGTERPRARALKRAWLFVLAIALHNFPEGLAIGVGFSGEDTVGESALATGIAIQDVPEGMVVALVLHGVGYGHLLAVIGIASGLIEPVAAVIGAGLMGLSASLLPWGLAAAAGAMLFVISHEIIPESHRQGHETCAATGRLLLGFVLMMVLHTALG